MASLIDRRKMMQEVSSEVPYIRDGLMFWLDGVNIGTNAGYWTDLIGGRLFEMIGDGVVHTNDRISIIQGSYLQQTTAENYTLTGHTFEICAQYIGQPNSTWIVGTANGSNMPIFVSYANGYFSYTNASRKLVLNAAPMLPFTFSKVGDADQSGVYLNLSDNITYGNSDSWGGASAQLVLGARGPGISVGFTGYIMSIRMYDRELTREEVLHNQAADNSRFNLGL